MGKAQIISEIGDGLYNIEVNYDSSIVDERLSILNDKIPFIESKIDEMIDQVIFAIASVSDAESILKTKTEAVENAESSRETFKSAMESDYFYQTAKQEFKDAENELSQALSNARKNKDPNAAPEYDILVVAAQNVFDNAQLALNNVTTKIAYDTACKNYDDAVKEKKAADKDLLQKQTELDTLVEVDQVLKMRLLLSQRQKAEFESYANRDYQTQAWCADLSSGLTGIVGTIEPVAEYENGINIRPGYSDSAVWNKERDGQAVIFRALPVEDAMLNFALMPAIQKWKPTYRYGTLSNIDYEANKGDVSLDVAHSHIQNILVNASSTLTNIPIEYMSCDAGAFENNDRVVVTWIGYDVANTAKVIGFIDNPKSCGWEEPWDGPTLTSKHSWVYWNQYHSSDVFGETIEGADAEITLSDGTCQIFYDWEYEAWLQEHSLFYVPCVAPDYTPFYGNATKMKFKATSGYIYCGTYVYQERSDWCFVGGFASDGAIIVIHLISGYTIDTPFTGCLTHPEMSVVHTNEDAWELTEGTIDPDDLDWAPPLSGEEQYTIRRYYKNVGPDNDNYYDFPETMVSVCAVGIEMSTNQGMGVGWTPGGNAGPGSINMDYIGII
jgi:hypothetical protein